jgi:hypothetical protein
MLTTPALIFGLLFCSSIWFMLAYGTRWGGDIDSASLTLLLRRKQQKQPGLKHTRRTF